MAGNWFVVLHRESAAAEVLRPYQTLAFEGHTALECSSVDWTNTHYLGLRLSPTPVHPSMDSQAWVPHHAVAAVMQAEPGQSRPIGFV
jgi:hypothetical protein